MKSIGILKSKITLNCEICGCKSKRTLIVNIFENTEAEKIKAKNEIIFRSKKKYTCRICKSIENAVN